MIAKCGLWNPASTAKKKWIILTCDERSEELKAQIKARIEEDRRLSKLRHPAIAHEMAIMDRKQDERDAKRQHGDFYFSENSYEIQLALDMINGGFEHGWPLYANRVYLQEGLKVKRYRNGIAKEAYRYPVEMPFQVRANVEFKMNGTWMKQYVHPRSMVRLQRIGEQLNFGPMMVTISNIMRAKDLFHDEGPVLGQMDKYSTVGFMTEEAATLFSCMIESGSYDDDYENWTRTG